MSLEEQGAGVNVATYRESSTLLGVPEVLNPHCRRCMWPVIRVGDVVVHAFSITVACRGAVKHWDQLSEEQRAASGAVPSGSVPAPPGPAEPWPPRNDKSPADETAPPTGDATERAESQGGAA